MDTLKRNTKSKQMILNLLQDWQSAISHECVEKRLKEKIDRDDSASTLPLNFVTTTAQPFIPDGCPKCSEAIKTMCLLLMFAACRFTVYAQDKISVLDKSDNTPVKFADVYFPDTKTVTYTDSSGQFALPAAVAGVLVQISATGYQTQLLQINRTDGTGVVHLLPSFHELQEIVVSANGSRLQGENVMNVERLNLKSPDIQGISLSEKLSSVAGLSNLATGGGIGKPVIRGMSGSRIAVFSQGIRIENQQWGDEHGLGLDDNGYEQVEIIKGPASLLYGSDALGGVIYFSDERFAGQNTLEAGLNTEYNANTDGRRNNAALKFSKQQWHVNLFGGHTSHGDYKDGNNEPVVNSRFNSTDFKSVLGYSGKKHTNTLKYGFLRENYGLSEADELGGEAVGGRMPVSPYQNLTTHILGSENTVFFEQGSSLKVDLGYVFNNRKEIEDGEAALNMNLNTVSYNLKWRSARAANRTDVSAGSQGMYQQNENSGETTVVPDAVTGDLGVFVVANHCFSEKSFWQTGVRFDGRRIRSGDFSKQFFAFNFSTGIFSPITEKLSFRTNLSSGFRAPNMYELLSDGVHEGTNRYEKGNRDLRTENSYQIDATMNYKSEHLELFMNPYFNHVRNFIHLQAAGGTVNGVPAYGYLQNDALVYGGEAGFHCHPHPLDRLHLESAVSNTFGRLLSGDRLSLMPSQKIKSTVSANFSGKTFMQKYSVYFQHIHSFAQNRVSEHETVTPAYDLLNAGIALELRFGRQPVRLNFALNNMLDEKYFDHLSRYKSEGILNIGRNLSVKLNLPLKAGFKTE